MEKIFNKISGFLYEKIIFFYIKKYYFKGKKLEIGPGENPYLTKGDVVYADKFTENLSKKFLHKTIESDIDNLPFKKNSFDIVLTSHTLEHVPNTIHTIKTLEKFIKKDGFLCLILPHKDYTFDKHRKCTSLEHHIKDYENSVGYDDQTHIHDFIEHSVRPYNHFWNSDAMDSDGNYNSHYLIEKGLVHYHVWTQNEIIDLLRYLGFSIVFSVGRMPYRKDSFMIIVRKC